VQGAEKEIIASHVAAGDVKIIYWPMLDLGPNATNAAIAAFCAGDQDPVAFWRYHDTLYDEQRSVYLANRDYFLMLAIDQGLDSGAFATCYDGEETRTLLETLDQARRDNQVGVRPTFDIIGPSGEAERIFGSQPFSAFDAIIQAKLP
jgi:protein-disulfide isomerase